MKLRLDKITSTPSGLVMGVLIQGPRASWIRFAILEVPFNEMDVTVFRHWVAWNTRQDLPNEQDIPLTLDWG